MKIRKLFLVCAIAMVFIVNSISAQVFRVSAFSQEGVIMGDITKKEINNKAAGYVDYGSSGGLEVNYFLKNNLGFGLRFAATNYGRDFETYESDLTEMLEITDDQYDMTQTYSFWSFGPDLGISYLIGLSKKLQLEPCFFFGFKGLISPYSNVIYSQDNITYQYRTKPKTYVGFSYSPGVKLNWNIVKHFGLFFSLEYEGNSFVSDDERSILYNYRTLEIIEREKTYTINSLNFGFGMAFRFGKGLDQ